MLLHGRVTISSPLPSAHSYTWDNVAVKSLAKKHDAENPARARLSKVISMKGINAKQPSESRG